MSNTTPAIPRRGGQPGNQNAKGNCGNPHPRCNLGNRGGKGAPRGNQNARKKPRGLQAILLAEYQGNLEAREWIEANREALASVSGEERGTDAVDIAIHQRLTPEYIAERGREFEFGLFVKPEAQDSENRLAA